MSWLMEGVLGSSVSGEQTANTEVVSHRVLYQDQNQWTPWRVKTQCNSVSWFPPIYTHRYGGHYSFFVWLFSRALGNILLFCLCLALIRTKGLDRFLLLMMRATGRTQTEMSCHWLEMLQSQTSMEKRRKIVEHMRKCMVKMLIVIMVPNQAMRKPGSFSQEEDKEYNTVF